MQYQNYRETRRNRVRERGRKLAASVWKDKEIHDKMKRHSMPLSTAVSQGMFSSILGIKPD